MSSSHTALDDLMKVLTSKQIKAAKNGGYLIDVKTLQGSA